MHKETGELKNMGLLEEELKKGEQKKEDWMDTGISEGMEVSIGNIKCRVRKITKKDIILRPIPPGIDKQRMVDEAIAKAKEE